MKTILAGLVCFFVLGSVGGQNVPWLPPRITVVDPSGTPMEGVKLIAIGMRDSTNDIVGTGVTGKDGTFDFSPVLNPRDHIYQVMATAARCGLGFARIRPDTAAYTITMSGGAKASVHVTDPQGKPMARVRLFAQTFSQGEGMSASFLSLGQFPNLALSAETDSSGNVTIGGLPAGAEVGFGVHDDRFADLTWTDKAHTGAPDTIVQADVTLRPGAVVEGRVTLEGKPVPGIQVGSQSLSDFGGWDARTDADGHYRLTQMRPGTYNVVLGLSGDLEKQWTAVAHAGVLVPEGGRLQDLNFSLVRGGLITGTVRYQDGSPAIDMPVGIYGPAHPKSTAWVQSVETDALGRYSARVPAGPQYVYVQVSGPKETSLSHATPTVAEGASVIADLQMQKPVGLATVTGTVVDRAGKPVSGAEVVAEPQVMDYRTLVTSSLTDASGRFILRVAPDDFPVELRSRKDSLGSATAVEAKSAGDFRLIAELGVFATAVGRVTDPSGRPLPIAHVQLFETHGQSSNSGPSAQSDEKGRFSIPRIRPDLPFFIEVRAKGYGVVQTNFAAPGSRSVDAATTILPVADAFVEGRVIDENGKPRAGVSVMVDPYTQDPTMTDGNGWFRVEEIPKGKVSIRAFQGGNLIERKAETGKDLVLTLKSVPSAPTPRVAARLIAPYSQAIELQTDGWVNSPPLTLSGLKGKVVILDFWAIWCGPCNRELPQVEALAKRFAGQPVVVIGVHDSSATEPELISFAKSKGLTYALAIDRKARDGFGITANAYGVQGIPTVVVIGKDGKIVEMPEGVQALAKLVAKLLKP